MMNKPHLIILAGGASKRMASSLPKALIEVRGMSLLDRQLKYFLPHVDQIVISVGSLTGGDQIIQYLAQHYPGSERIQVAVEMLRLDTAGGIKKAASLITGESDTVIAVNVDDLTNIPVDTLAMSDTPTLCIVEPTSPYGVVEYDHDTKLMRAFREKPKLTGLWTSCGWYVLSKRSILEKFPDKGSIEKDVFEVGVLPVRVYEHRGFWISFNTPKDVDEANNATFPPEIDFSI